MMVSLREKKGNFYEYFWQLPNPRLHAVPSMTGTWIARCGKPAMLFWMEMTIAFCAPWKKISPVSCRSSTMSILATTFGYRVFVRKTRIKSLFWRTETVFFWGFRKKRAFLSIMEFWRLCKLGWTGCNPASSSISQKSQKKQRPFMGRGN